MVYDVCMKQISKEPVAIANGVLAIGVALLGLLSTFGIWTPTAEQLGALTAFYTAAAAFVIYAVRGTVYSPDAVQNISDAVQLVRTAPDAELAEEADAVLGSMLPAPRI